MFKKVVGLLFFLYIALNVGVIVGGSARGAVGGGKSKVFWTFYILLLSG